VAARRLIFSDRSGELSSPKNPGKDGPMATMTLKQIYAMRARQAAEKAQAEKVAKRKAAARRGVFVTRARARKAAAQAAA
jgi:hypothetical protein